MVNKSDDVSTNVLTHQQVKLVQVGHDELMIALSRSLLSAVSLWPPSAVRPGLIGPELIEVTQCGGSEGVCTNAAGTWYWRGRVRRS